MVPFVGTAPSELADKGKSDWNSDGVGRLILGRKWVCQKLPNSSSLPGPNPTVEEVI